jgi:hypothetical protein
MQYYIQNKDRGYLGNAIIFWAKDRRGYTADLNKAHVFTKEEAEQICNRNPEKNKAWNVDYINNNKGIQKIVDSQYLDESEIETF